mmetsp:Transcript_14852/g.36350  ORF Transcript_14852/g.36350 Transcript_14852/m.36350 type:complete len:242 (-) Transcript_14852:8-733(-)
MRRGSMPSEPPWGSCCPPLRSSSPSARLPHASGRGRSSGSLALGTAAVVRAAGPGGMGMSRTGRSSPSSSTSSAHAAPSNTGSLYVSAVTGCSTTSTTGCGAPPPPKRPARGTLGGPCGLCGWATSSLASPSAIEKAAPVGACTFQPLARAAPALPASGAPPSPPCGAFFTPHTGPPLLRFQARCALGSTTSKTSPCSFFTACSCSAAPFFNWLGSLSTKDIQFRRWIRRAREPQVLQPHT